MAALCGAAFSRKGEGLCYRGGSEQTNIIVHGAKYRIRRPRVRDEAGEVELESLRKPKTQDLLYEKINHAGWNQHPQLREGHWISLSSPDSLRI